MAPKMLTSFERCLLFTPGEITDVDRLRDLGHGNLLLADVLLGLVPAVDLLERRSPALRVVHVDLPLGVAPQDRRRRILNRRVQVDVHGRGFRDAVVVAAVQGVVLLRVLRRHLRRPRRVRFVVVLVEGVGRRGAAHGGRQCYGRRAGGGHGLVERVVL